VRAQTRDRAAPRACARLRRRRDHHPLRITEEFLAELSRLRLPAVVIGNLPSAIRIDNVRANSALGVGLAVEHLVAVGRWRIGFLNGPLDTTPGRLREDAFDAVTSSAGLALSRDWRVVAEHFTFEAGARAARQLLTSFGGELDAIVAANDLIAAGTFHVAFDLGLRVPEDLAVVGMDNSALAGQLHPTLTSVSLGSAARGRDAAELLLARLRDRDRPAARVVVQPELVVRSSTPGEPAAGSLGPPGRSTPDRRTRP
jgi:LacI family transcriptional regulator